MSDLGTFGLLKMSQPISNVGLLSVNYPEKNHSQILRGVTRLRGKLFRLKIESTPSYSYEHDRKLIEKVLDENEKYLDALENKPNSVSAAALLKCAKDQVKSGAAHSAPMLSKSDSFRICALILNEPLSFESIKNRPLLKNSADRVDEALLSTIKSNNSENGKSFYFNKKI